MMCRDQCPSGGSGSQAGPGWAQAVFNAYHQRMQTPPGRYATDLPKGIGLYASFLTLPPGGSSDSEGRAAASPVFAISLP